MLKKKSGFTLIEVLLVVVLIAGVALLMYSFLGQGFSLYTVETASAEEQAGLRQILSDITNKARITPVDQITYANSILTIGDYVYTYNGDAVARNGATIANDINIFSINITDNILGVIITNASGTTMKTSISLIR